MESTSSHTIRAAIAASQRAYAALIELAEDVEDEWSYVNDLAAAWSERLEDVAEARGGEPAGDAVAVAIDALAAEAAAIDDPHRAIDWLSTFPQIALIALGERP